MRKILKFCCGYFSSVVSYVAVISLIPAASVIAQGIGLPGQSKDKPIEINADEGIEWRQKQKLYVARGNARASQGQVTVSANTLTAHYREKNDQSTEIWRIDAEGNVQIITPTQKAAGNKGVYDVDNGILILTGSVRLDTKTDKITARDSLEYWEKRNLAVARGNAIAVRGQNRLRADLLTAHFVTDENGKSRVQQLDAFDNIVITTPDEIVRSNRGIYNLDTGVAKLSGSVKITRGKDKLQGAYAEVNLNTGVSKLYGRGAAGVRGVFMPKKRGKSKGYIRSKPRRSGD